MKRIYITLTVLLITTSLFSQKNIEKGINAITQESIEGQMEFLASDWMEGREMGQKGAYMASDYIVSIMKTYGLKPLWNDYYQNFPVIEYKANGKQELSISIGNKVYSFDNNTDFKIWINNVSQEISSELVFVGYGLQFKDKKYDDFKGIDIKNKIVIALNGFPGHLDKGSKTYNKFKPKNRRERRRYSNIKYEVAKKKGALGVISISSQQALLFKAKNHKFFYKNNLYEGEKAQESFASKRFDILENTLDEKLLNVKISKRIANLLLKSSKTNYRDIEEKINKTAKPNSFKLKDIKIKLKSKVKSHILKCRNVAGYIKGKDSTKNIIIGAHYDHLGKYNGYIWNGADDNASGVVGMLSIAKAFLNTGEQPEKNIIFVSFTGEEKGLIGSRYFASKMPKDMNCEYMLNLDMMSRDSKTDTLKNRCELILNKNSNQLQNLLNESIKKYKLNLRLLFWESNGHSGSSDHSPFARKGIPYNFFWSGYHKDYHQVSDETSLTNWEKIVNLSKLGFIHLYEIDKKGLLK